MSSETLKNIFIYDQRNYFFVFLKKKYSKKYNLVKLNDIDLMKIENFAPNDIGIFISHNEKDIVPFFSFYRCLNERVFICTEKTAVANKFQKMYRLKTIDISKPRKTYDAVLTYKIETLFK